MTAVSRSRALLVAVALIATLALAQAATPPRPSAEPALETLPLVVGDWNGQAAPPLDPEIARVLAADAYVHRFYTAAPGTIEMDVAYYAQPRVGSNMHSPLNCLPGTGWTVLDPRRRRVATSAGTWDVREMMVRRGTVQYAMTYWFQSRSRVIGDEFAARFQLLSDAVRRQPTDAGLVRLMMPAPGDSVDERYTLAAFAAELVPAIGATFR